MRYLKILYVQVLIGIIAGIIVGAFFPSFAPVARMISGIFINMITMMIAPVIFFTVVLGIAGAGNLKQVGRIGGKALIYFEVMTTFALIIGLVVANLVTPGKGLDTAGLHGVDISAYAAEAKEMNWMH